MILNASMQSPNSNSLMMIPSSANPFKMPGTSSASSSVAATSSGADGPGPHTNSPLEIRSLIGAQNR
uniref:Uncharacterized protein n=1 Tax=Caenorhabditis japonica TaxID=281687 RepID=A0A8R1ING0_CAEJA